MRTGASSFCIFHSAFCILHFPLCARSLRGCAATALHNRSGPAVRQVVSAEQHPCFTGGRVRWRPSDSKTQNQLGKVVARKVRYFERRDYRDTRPTDQGGLARMVDAASACAAICCSVAEWNPPHLVRDRPLAQGEMVSGLFGCS